MVNECQNIDGQKEYRNFWKVEENEEDQYYSAMQLAQRNLHEEEYMRKTTNPER